MPKDVERRLIIMRVEPDHVVGLSEPGHGSILNLSDPVDKYQDDWRLVSHDFTLMPDGSARLSILFERWASASSIAPAG